MRQSVICVLIATMFGWLASSIAYDFFPPERILQQGREQVLNYEVACVLDNMKWKCKTREEIEQEVKFLMQLQGNTPPAKPKGSNL